MIKVLSILQPWASLSVLGHKKIETRSWNTKYRGVLYIHASMGKNFRKLHHNDPLYNFYHPLFAYNKIEPMEKLPFGAIIGKVDLVGVVESKFCFDGNEFQVKDDMWTVTPQELAFGDYSPNRFGWLLANPVMFDKPIPAKGKLSIWNYEFIGHE